MEINDLRLERVRIAMEEYKVLHAELLQRNTILNQFTAAGISAAVAVIGFSFNSSVMISNDAAIALITLIIFVLSLAWWLVHVDAKKACERLIEIEQYVNSEVGGDEIMPLSWETRFGLLSRGYISRFQSN